MKRAFFLSAITTMVCGPALAKTWVLTNDETGMDKGNWQIGSQQLNIQDRDFSIEQRVLHGGKQEGSKIVVIRSSGLTITLSPTRGMSLLKVAGFETKMGWNSPVKGVVNPAFINLESRNGLGWLEGFNEMMVRCGYEWTGHPVTVDGHIYTLHGKAGNTPASLVEVEVADTAPYEIRIRGLIKENTFKKGDLQTLTELSYVPGSNSFSVHDILTNHDDYPQDYQIIYHSNFGTPLLEEGARFLAPVHTISPFNNRAKKGLRSWQTYAAPSKNFDEMVFNVQPVADEDNLTLAAIVNKAGDKGASIQFDTRQLPVLTLWKNTDTEKHGYVTGIAPGTSYAYPVTVERAQKRVKQLAPGESAYFDLTYTLLYNKEQVANAERRISAIQGKTKVTVQDTPLAKE